MIKKLTIWVVALVVAFAGLTPSTTEAYSAYKADKIIKTANRYLGTPYEFGAKYGQTRTFDCSSFTKYVYAKNGIYLPRTSRDQAKRGTAVSMKNLRKGDLVFFKASRHASSRITHVAIYAGNNRLLHTYGQGGVRYTKFNDYWKSRYVKARRVL
jgi:cell wall-associated NlpC family hydrolase